MRSDIDFSALEILCAVHEEMSFTRAAQRLERSQSSVSYAIDRLRRAFDDPLFIRSGGGLVATERCGEVTAEARRVLERFDELGQRAPFDPAASQGLTRISMNVYERQIILPPLLAALRSRAPGLRLKVTEALVHGAEHLLSGAADLTISPVEADEPRLEKRRVLSDDYVCVTSHDRDDGPLTSQAYAALPHIVVDYGRGWRSPYQRSLDRLGLEVNVAATLPSPAHIEGAVLSADLVSTLPRRVAQRMGPGVKVLELPFAARFDVYASWSVISARSPLQSWLRQTLFEICEELERSPDQPQGS